MKVKVWHLYIVPVLLIGFAIYEYIDLTAWETEGGVRYMGRRTRALYKLGGKWGVVGVTAGAAAFWAAALFTYIRYSRRIRRGEEEEAMRAAGREVEIAEAREAREPKPIPTSKPSGPVAAPSIPTFATRDARPEPDKPAKTDVSSPDDEPSILK